MTDGKWKVSVRSLGLTTNMDLVDHGNDAGSMSARFTSEVSLCYWH